MTTPSEPKAGHGVDGAVTAAQAASLLLALARALHEAGQPAHRLEETLLRAAARFGVPLEVFSLPVGILLSFHQNGRSETFFVRLQPGTVNLERLAQLTAVANDIIRGQVSAGDARARVEQIVSAPPRWGGPVRVAAYVCSAAAFAVFFGGGVLEVGVATVIGLAVGLIALATQRLRVSGRVFELTAATAAAVITGTMDSLTGAFVEWIPLASGLIILLPGLSLEDALEELANGHLASGGTRLAGVAVVFLALTFGVLVGYRAAEALTPAGPTPEMPSSLPGWAVLPALVVVTIGSIIRFRARWSDGVVIFVASALALGGAQVGKGVFGPLAGPFLGALLLGLAANLYARWRRQAVEVWLTPGLALLVPGSVGVKSLAAMLSQNTDVGIYEAFQMFLIATALAAGLLFSNAIVRDRPPG
jgi:uncharacterized membrane protein YjjP (DUF1212 family)